MLACLSCDSNLSPWFSVIWMSNYYDHCSVWLLGVWLGAQVLATRQTDFWNRRWQWYFSPIWLYRWYYIMGWESWKGASRSWASTTCQVRVWGVSECSLNLPRSLQEVLHNLTLGDAQTDPQERWEGLAEAEWTTGGGATRFTLPHRRPLPLRCYHPSLSGASKRGQKEEERGELCWVVLPLLSRRTTRCSVTCGQRQRFQEESLLGTSIK